MGICLIGSHSSYDRYPDRNFYDESLKKLPNPDPSNFTVSRQAKVGKFLVLKVNYPDCKNYEGDKILVYENVDIDGLQKQGTLDPHFSNNKNYHSPIARFEPTERGWMWATALATWLSLL